LGAGLKPILLHPDTKEPQLLMWLKERAEYRILDPALEPDIDRIRAGVRGDFGIVSRDLSDRRWIVYDLVDAGSGRYLSYDRDLGDLRVLFEERPALENHQLAAMEPFSFTSRDGLTVHGYVTLPPGT